MNRRGFLASIPFLPPALKAVAASLAAPVALNDDYKCVITTNFKGSITSRQWHDYDFVCDAKTKEHIDLVFAKYYREKYGVTT